MNHGLWRRAAPEKSRQKQDNIMYVYNVCYIMYVYKVYIYIYKVSI